jgi:phospholipid/cholesterol/gamma-HCH transport system substrate-binding protein
MAEKRDPDTGGNPAEAHTHHGEEVPAMVTGRDKKKRTFRVGIFALIAFFILLITIFVLGDKQQLFSSTFSIYTTFKTVQGLKSGAFVTLNGIKIGTVNNVQLKQDTATYVRVDMQIDGDYRNFIKTSTLAVISQTGLIGDKEIDLELADPTAPVVADGGHIHSEEPTDYTAIFDEARVAVRNAQSITSSIDTLFLRFRRGEGTFGKLLTDETAYDNLVKVTNSTDQLVQQTNKQLGAISGTLNAAAANVNDITVESRKLVADIGNGKGTVGALLYDRSLYDSLTSLTGTLTKAADNAGFAAREFGINMRGLRSSWLGGLFKGSEEEQQDVDLRNRELDIKMEEIRRQKELLDQREHQLMLKEASSRK